MCVPAQDSLGSVHVGRADDITDDPESPTETQLPANVEPAVTNVVTRPGYTFNVRIFSSAGERVASGGSRVRSLRRLSPLRALRELSSRELAPDPVDTLDTEVGALTREHEGDTTPQTTTQPAPPAKRRRRFSPLTVCVVAATAVFALAGIGTPLFGTTVFADTGSLGSYSGYRDVLAGVGVQTEYQRDLVDDQMPNEILFGEAFRNGQFAAWNPYALGGGPLGSTPNQAIASPLSAPYWVLPGWLAPAYEKLLELICAIGGMVLFLRRLRLTRPAAWLGALVFAGSAFMVVWTGWPQTRVAALIPALFWAVECLAQRTRPREVALVALPVAAMMLGGFPAVAGYALVTAAVYYVVRLAGQYPDPFWRHWRALVVRSAAGGAGVLAGLGLVAWQLVPWLHYMNTVLVGNRAQDINKIIPPESLLTTIAPYALGTVSPAHLPNWFGGLQLIDAESYLGAAALILVVAAVALARTSRSLLPRGMWAALVATAGVWTAVIYFGGWPLWLLQHMSFLFSENFVGRARSVLGFLLATLAAVGFDALVRRGRARAGAPLLEPVLAAVPVGAVAGGAAPAGAVAAGAVADSAVVDGAVADGAVALPAGGPRRTGRAKAALAGPAAVAAPGVPRWLARQTWLPRYDWLIADGGHGFRRVYGTAVWTALVAGGIALYFPARHMAVAGDTKRGDTNGTDVSFLNARLLVGGLILVVAAACAAWLWFGPSGRDGRRRWLRRAAAGLLPLLIAGQSLAWVQSYYPRTDKDNFYPTTPTQTYLADHLGHDRYYGADGAIFGSVDVTADLRSFHGHGLLEQNFADLAESLPGEQFTIPATAILSDAEGGLTAVSPMLDRSAVSYYIAPPAIAPFGSLQSEPANGPTITLQPGQTVNLAIPVAGPLRGIGITPAPAGDVPAGPVSIRVRILDAAGHEVASNARSDSSPEAGQAWIVPLAAENVPAHAHLTAQVTVLGTDPVTVASHNGHPAVTTVAAVSDGLTLVYAQETTIYQRTRALPRAHWASATRVVPDSTDRISLEASGLLKPDEVVLNAAGPAASGQPATVTWVDDGLNQVVLDVSAQGAGYLVLDDAIQDGWRASIDGAPTTLLPADHAYVTVAVPAGHHTIRFWYPQPWSGPGPWISGLTVLLLLGCLGADRWWRRRYT